ALDSNPFTISAAAAAQLVFVDNPANVTAGTTLADLHVDVRDAFGNATKSSTAATLVAVGAGSLVGTTTAQASAGVATFSGLSLEAAGSYTLSASASGLQGAATTSFKVSAAPASQLAFAANPVGAGAGQTLAADVQVNLLDPFGNLVDGGPISLSANG